MLQHLTPISGVPSALANAPTGETNVVYGPDLASILAGNLETGFTNSIQTAQDNISSMIGLGSGTSANSISTVPDEVQDDGTSVGNAADGGFSLSNYMAEHPGATAEEIMAEAAKYGDEFAEKYLDYLVESQQLAAANKYTADREDTAYQRLVEDLKRAGLNPAMMYGSSASPSAAGSQGYVKMTEGANSRTVANYTKIKDLLLAILQYELNKGLGIANTTLKGVSTIGNLIPGLMKVFA